MSHSKFEYVRGYESDDKLLPNSWIVVRVDGKAFHKFSDAHAFAKPNDKPALDLMTEAAIGVMKNMTSIDMAYGQSDEYSFVFRKDSNLYGRRASKLMTNVVSLFASTYVYKWTEVMGADRPLQYPPAFDARAVLYPTNKNLRDYLSWRQVDCHINNLYNTTFWTLIQKGGLTNRQAEERLKGTFSNDKNEILFTDFGINYNNEPLQFKKGTFVWRKNVEIPIEEKLSALEVEEQNDSNEEKTEEQKEVKSEEQNETKSEEQKEAKKSGDKKFSRQELREMKTKFRNKIVTEYCDIINDTFWDENPHLLEPFKDS